MGGGSSVRKDIPFPQSQSTLFYTGNMEETRQGGLLTLPREAPSTFQFLKQIRMCLGACACISSKNTAVSEVGECCSDGRFYRLPYHLTLLPTDWERGGKLPSPSLPYSAREVQFI